MTASSPIRVVFSALYAESDAFLDTFIGNFLLFTGPEALLLINLPPGRALPERPTPIGDRVRLFNGRITRAKLGHTLLAAHIESLRFASDLLGTFDYFCPMASNSLFVRRFDLAAAERSLDALTSLRPITVLLDDVPDEWCWRTVERDGRLVPFLRTRWGLDIGCSFQIEGNLAGRDDWMEVGRRLDEVLETPGLASPPLPFPVEEILPAIVFNNFGSGRHIRICHISWARGPAAPLTVTDVIRDLWALEPEICMAKWFERSATDPTTAALSTGWSAALLDELSRPVATIPQERRLISRLLLEELARSLREREGFEPITQRWWPHPALDGDRMLRFRRTLTADLHGFALDDTLTLPSGDAAAYVIREEMDRPLDLEIRIEQMTGAVHIVAGPPIAVPEPHDPAPAPAGYLYLAPLAGTARTAIRFRVPEAVGSDKPFSRLMIRDAKGLSQLSERHRARSAGYTEAYFMIADLDVSGGFWLGLPFFHGQRFDATVEVL